MNMQEDNRENVFHERTTILKDQGYRGFTVTGLSQEWESTQVTVKNKSGKTIKASGETKEEAYQNVIKKIDLLMD